MADGDTDAEAAGDGVVLALAESLPATDAVTDDDSEADAGAGETLVDGVADAVTVTVGG